MTLEIHSTYEKQNIKKTSPNRQRVLGSKNTNPRDKVVYDKFPTNQSKPREKVTGS